MDKYNIRKDITNKLSNMSNERKINKDILIFNKIINMPEYRYASSIMLYKSKETEISTETLINKSLADGKAVLLPIIMSNSIVPSRIMENGPNTFKTGKFGINEPIIKDIYNSLSIQFLVIPGIAFDTVGNRLGHGYGFYDKFLKTVSSSCDIVGICYTEQLYENILPITNSDVPVKWLVTETDIYKLF